MRLPPTEHTRRPWRIHALTEDFRLEDVWALPTPGGPGDFPRLVRLFAAGEPSGLLWAIRERLGGLLGWDDASAGVGARVPSLRERLPADLRDAPPGTVPAPFAPVYETGDEAAAELANATVHGVLHLSWVDDGAGGHRGQMAVLVKPNGRLGDLYMLAIKPFRYAFVYPALLRRLGRRWEVGSRG